MLVFLLLIPFTKASFFGGSGCGCAPPPVCPPPPVCAPPSCGSSFAGSYASPPYQPQYSSSPHLEPAYLLVPPVTSPVVAPPLDTNSYAPQKVDYSTSDGVRATRLKSNSASDMYPNSDPRVRRDNEAASDPKCNSEALKEIILENMDRTTGESKRQIQEAATEKLGGRIRHRQAVRPNLSQDDRERNH
ncbi:hypothetical protein KIN20_034677 [Parelaphostrongylus tenuis]|uniref:Ground-like domain-containing protein n=1 Tax=Parelaphostrongylus tenuis TaxID=148309 RepID=A0AAD5RAP4_PARTN|nr:hypothetical protein KIN20_034677 [Parelaphostrongylus tenuis]